MVDFDPKELKNSKRIFKSATPKYDISWYIKWVSSFTILTAITIRASGVTQLAWLDMLLSWVGSVGWFFVGLLWKDRAVLILNGVISIILFSGLINLWFTNT